ncbi:MAG TPA: hypothetical protein VJY62_04475 [Bacteroidia bacterium]|nr:hypothetical protein [Bacteroidia bacterium]
MKRFIITSAALMCAALLYGAVDFMISKNHGDLTGLYHDTPNVEVPGVTTTKTEPAPAEAKFNFVSEPRTITVATNEKAQKQKTKKTPEREIKLEEFSRAALDDVVAEEEIENDSAKALVTEHNVAKPPLPSLVHVIDSFATVPIKANAVKPKRKISSDKFSRGPLRVETHSQTLVLNDSIKK